MSGLGLTANSRRNIKSGVEYDKYFPKPDGGQPYFSKNGSVEDTVKFMSTVVNNTLSHTAKISRHPDLTGKTELETCKKIWEFAYNHIQYHIDEPGIEQIRSPRRTWADRKKGVDCDCFSVFVASILKNKGIPYKFRIAKYKPYLNYQHVYIVAFPNNFKGNEYIIDPVIDKPGEEKAMYHKKDFNMQGTELNGIPIQYLDGIDGGADDKIIDYLTRVKQRVENNPGMWSNAINVQTFVQQLSEIIAKPDEKEKLILAFAGMEQVGDLDFDFFTNLYFYIKGRRTFDDVAASLIPTPELSGLSGSASNDRVLRIIPADKGVYMDGKKNNTLYLRLRVPTDKDRQLHLKRTIVVFDTGSPDNNWLNRAKNYQSSQMRNDHIYDGVYTIGSMYKDGNKVKGIGTKEYQHFYGDATRRLVKRKVKVNRFVLKNSVPQNIKSLLEKQGLASYEVSPINTNSGVAGLGSSWRRRWAATPMPTVNNKEQGRQSVTRDAINQHAVTYTQTKNPEWPKIKNIDGKPKYLVHNDKRLFEILNISNNLITIKQPLGPGKDDFTTYQVSIDPSYDPNSIYHVLHKGKTYKIAIIPADIIKNIPADILALYHYKTDPKTGKKSYNFWELQTGVIVEKYYSTDANPKILLPGRNVSEKTVGLAPVRGAFLLLMKFNFMGLGYKITLGLLPWDIVKHTGVDKLKWAKYAKNAKKSVQWWVTRFGGVNIIDFKRGLISAETSHMKTFKEIVMRHPNFNWYFYYDHLNNKPLTGMPNTPPVAEGVYHGGVNGVLPDQQLIDELNGKRNPQCPFANSELGDPATAVTIATAIATASPVLVPLILVTLGKQPAECKADPQSEACRKALETWSASDPDDPIDYGNDNSSGEDEAGSGNDTNDSGIMRFIKDNKAMVGIGAIATVGLLSAAIFMKDNDNQ